MDIIFQERVVGLLQVSGTKGHMTLTRQHANQEEGANPMDEVALIHHDVSDTQLHLEGNSKQRC